MGRRSQHSFLPLFLVRPPLSTDVLVLLLNHHIMDKGWALIRGRALTKGGGGRLSQRGRSLAEIGYLAMFGFIINNTTQGKK